MKGSIIRLVLAVAGVGVLYFGGYELIKERAPRRTRPETISVEVRDPETDPWLKEEKKRLEEERKRVEAEKRSQKERRKRLEEEEAGVARQRKLVEESLKQVRDQMEKMAPRENDLKSREEAVERLQEKLDKTQEEMDRRAEIFRKGEEDLATREEKTRVEREEIAKRQSDLEKLAETLVRQQADQAERTRNLELKESSMESREKEAKEMAKVLLERQEEIREKQRALEESQKNISESQTERDREWERVREEWKKIEIQRRALEAKLESAKTTAKDWEALKAEWRNLEAQRKSLEEAQEVRENVERFRKQFNRSAYEHSLERLKASVKPSGLKEGYIDFNFKFWPESQMADHLKYYGIVDLYLNFEKERYLLVEDYDSGAFSREGDWDEAVQGEIARTKAPFMIKREHDFYRSYIRRAERRIGKGIIVRGLMPISLFYEIVLHQQRVVKLFGLRRGEIRRFYFAPWRDGGAGKWMFKIVEVRKTDGTSIKIQNYNF